MDYNKENKGQKTNPKKNQHIITTNNNNNNKNNKNLSQKFKLPFIKMPSSRNVKNTFQTISPMTNYKVDS